MSTFWFKILQVIDNVNKVIQAHDSTIDVEVKNIDGLTENLHDLRNKWDDIYGEVQLVASNMDITSHHRLVGIRQSMGDITPETYHFNVFYMAIDSVLAGLNTRYRAMYGINSTFKVL